MENNKVLFFDNSNFNLLYNILKKDLNSKFNYYLEDKQGKSKLFNVMNQIYIKNGEKNLKELNLLCLRSVAPILKNMCENQNNQNNIINDNNRNSSLQRDMIMNKKVPEFVDLRPEYLDKSNKNINEEYNNMNERYNIKKPQTIDFSLPVDNSENIQELDTFQNDREKDLYNENNDMSTDINSLKKNNSLVDFEEKQKNMSKMIDLEINKRNERNERKELKFIEKQQEREIPENFINQSQNYDGEKSLMDERNYETFQIIKNNNNDNVEFYKNNLNISEEINNDLIQYQEIKENKEDNIIKREKNETSTTQHYLEITSLSRNWENLPNISQLNKFSTRYNFCVNFNPAVNEWVNIPIYENNIFTFASIYPDGNIIPYSESNIEIYNEILKTGICPDININDPLLIYQQEFYDKEINDKDIIRNPFYNPDKPKGEIIYYVKKLISGNNGATVMSIYKNIQKIKLDSIIIPFDYLFTFSNIVKKEDLGNLIKLPINEKINIDNYEVFNPIFEQSIFSYPYLILHIEELDGIYDSTSDAIRKCFCKVSYYDDWSTNTFASNETIAIPGRFPGFVIMKPANQEEEGKLYPQSALANLNKMTIRILTPQGDILNLNTDNAIIEQICYVPLTQNTFSKKYIAIRTKNWLPSNMFLVNQVIQISNYNLLMKSENQEVNIGIDYLSGFLNRNEGHTIVNIGHIKNCQELGVDNIIMDSNQDGYINILFIKSDGYFEEEDGIWYPSLGVKNKEGQELVSQELLEYLVSPGLRGACYGRLINISVQINLSFSITTIDSDISKIESHII